MDTEKRRQGEHEIRHFEGIVTRESRGAEEGCLKVN